MTRKRTLKGDRKVRLRDSLGIYYTFIHLPERKKGNFTFIANAVGISSPYATPPPNNAITVSSCKELVVFYVRRLANTYLDSPLLAVNKPLNTLVNLISPQLLILSLKVWFSKSGGTGII